ncbi:MAG: RNA polymerase sigma factor [Pseudomonadota bacterium]
MIAEIEDKFVEIYQEYYAPVCNYIYRSVKNQALAEDLTQETFIKVLGAMGDFEASRKLGPWLYRIARNTCIDWFRCNKQTFELIDDAIRCGNDYESPERIVLDREQKAVIKDMFMKMNIKYRPVMLLRYIGELSYSEVASKLELKEATVKTLIRRGRQQFQKAYPEAY